MTNEQAEVTQPTEADWEAASAFGRSAGGVDVSLLADYMMRHRQAAKIEERAEIVALVRSFESKRCTCELCQRTRRLADAIEARGGK